MHSGADCISEIMFNSKYFANLSPSESVLASHKFGALLKCGRRARGVNTGLRLARVVRGAASFRNPYTVPLMPNATLFALGLDAALMASC